MDGGIFQRNPRILYDVSIRLGTRYRRGGALVDIDRLGYVCPT